MLGWSFWRCILLPMHCRRSLRRSLVWRFRFACRHWGRAPGGHLRVPGGLVRFVRSRREGCTSLRLLRPGGRGRLLRGATSLPLPRVSCHWRFVSRSLQRRTCSSTRLGEAMMVMITTAGDIASARSFSYRRSYWLYAIPAAQIYSLATSCILQHRVGLRKQWSTVGFSKQKVSISMSISCAISADCILVDRRLRPSCVAAGGGSTIPIPPIRSTSAKSNSVASYSCS